MSSQVIFSPYTPVNTLADICLSKPVVSIFDNLTKLGSCCVMIGYTSISYSTRNRRSVQLMTSSIVSYWRHKLTMKWRRTIATSNLIGWQYTVNQSNLTTIFSAKYIEVFDRNIGLKVTRPRRDGSSVVQLTYIVVVVLPMSQAGRLCLRAGVQSWVAPACG